MKFRIALVISVIIIMGLLLFIYFDRRTTAPPFTPFHVRTDFNDADLISDGYIQVPVDVYMLGKTVGDLTMHYQVDEETGTSYWREAIIETHMKTIDTLGIYKLIESYDADIELPTGMDFERTTYTPPLTAWFFVKSRINHQIFECSLGHHVDTTTYQISVVFEDPNTEPWIIDGKPYQPKQDRKRFGPDTTILDDGGKYIVNYWNWTRQGETITVRPNGKISEIDFFKEGELQHTQGYSEEGLIQYDILSYNMTGTSKWWYPNGVLMEEIEYKNGKQEGRYTGYYDNGKVMVSGQLAGGSYDTAKRDGEWTFYDSLGRPKRKEYYDLDSLIKMVTY